MAGKLNLILTLLLIICSLQIIEIRLLYCQEYQLDNNEKEYNFQGSKDIKKRIQHVDVLIADNKQLQAIEEYEEITKLYNHAYGDMESSAKCKDLAEEMFEISDVHEMENKW